MEALQATGTGALPARARVVLVLFAATLAYGLMLTIVASARALQVLR